MVIVQVFFFTCIVPGGLSEKDKRSGWPEKRTSLFTNGRWINDKEFSWHTISYKALSLFLYFLLYSYRITREYRTPERVVGANRPFLSKCTRADGADPKSVSCLWAEKYIARPCTIWQSNEKYISEYSMYEKSERKKNILILSATNFTAVNQGLLIFSLFLPLSISPMVLNLTN